MTYIQNSLSLLGDFFSQNKIQYWLEAGTALAAYRDGEIFQWDHDIDVAMWRSEMPEPKKFIEYFEKEGFNVIFQKDLPFTDNIIQLKVCDGFQDKLIDVDIYLYTLQEGFAYMRWIQKPEGSYKDTKKWLLTVLKYIVNPKNKKWERISKFTFVNISLVLFSGKS